MTVICEAFFMYTVCAQRDAQSSDVSFHAMQVIPV